MLKRLTARIRNLRIGTKLALTSAIIVIGVIGMAIVQMIGTAAISGSNAAAISQYEIARDIMAAKASVTIVADRCPRPAAGTQPGGNAQCQRPDPQPAAGLADRTSRR